MEMNATRAYAAAKHGVVERMKRSLILSAAILGLVLPVMAQPAAKPVAKPKCAKGQFETSSQLTGEVKCFEMSAVAGPLIPIKPKARKPAPK